MGQEPPRAYCSITVSLSPLHDTRILKQPIAKCNKKTEFRYLSYESRLLECGLTTLETRRLRGNQIEVFKIVNGYEDVDRNMFFKLKEGSRTKGHKAALVKEQCRLDMRKYSFSQRVINEWNKLPNDCVNASSVNMFKNRIYRYLIRAGYTKIRELLDSRKANGFLVHLLSGTCCLGWQSC